MQQISVSLPDEVLRFVEKTAQRDCRTTGAQVRYLLTEAARRAGNGAANLESWPPLLPVITPDNMATAREVVAELQQEYDALRSLEAKTPTGLLPHQDERLRFARDRIDQLTRQLRPLEAARGVRHG